MNKIIYKFIILLLSLSNTLIYAQCQAVYTIGAYDEGFNKHATIIKFGPLKAADATFLPKTFLEGDGSYAGGEAFCTFKNACVALKQQLANKILVADEHWHIYLLQATWQHDVYRLHNNDFRIKHAVKVLSVVKKAC